MRSLKQSENTRERSQTCINFNLDLMHCNNSQVQRGGKRQNSLGNIIYNQCSGNIRDSLFDIYIVYNILEYIF